MDSSLIRARPTRPLPKPSLLKDHLLDDMSSCSSNGFKSFPRSSQCCTTVRFLHVLHRKTQKQKKHLKFGKNPPKSALSAFRKVFFPAKRLPFAARTQGKTRVGSPSLARSLSRKITGFWKRKKKSDEEEVIGRWGLPDRRTEDESEPLNESGDSRSDSWSSGSGFTVSVDFLSSGKYSSPELNLNLLDNGNDVVRPEKEGGGACTKSAADSTKIKQLTSDCQEKEQFSPVSVLDCSFDEEDEVSSRFQHRLAHVEGTKAKLMKTIQRFEGLAKLEPINLATKFASHSDFDHEYSSGSFDSSPVDEKSTLGAKDKEDEDEQEALEMMYQMKNTYLASLNLETETLVLDFFREKISDKRANSEKMRCGPLFEKELVEEARDWINGEKDAKESFMGWEVEKGRRAHVDDMEKRGEWRGLDEEIDEVGLELENVFFVELMDELLLEISS
ncbi:hypothetical protein STAS_17205 [Striga asiatica]|uniref:DUF4378 domain-containing protein n=1 Tax=Striga asiatica TaxID=4170 RepID=A0A5A7Q6G0_STRAF|nr:hypothetical protein STAS_17205 [Striga asiatica]